MGTNVTPQSIQRMKEGQRRYYERNRELVKQRKKDAQQRNMQYLHDIKSKGSCVKCGASHVAILDFHHLDPTGKEEHVSTAAWKGWALDRLQTEIDKCVLICANCHRVLHWENKSSRSTTDSAAIF